MNKDQIFIDHISGHLGPGQEVVCKICGRTVEEIADQPAPSTKERGEMMEYLHKVVNSHAKHIENGDPVHYLLEWKRKVKTLILAQPVSAMKDFPKIICFCGSVRFSTEMMVVAWEYAKAGYIVLSWCVLPDCYFEAHPESSGDDQAGIHVAEKEGVRKILDEVHKRKIDLADEVLVINVGGYVGDSTKSEIRYARAHMKPIRWLEPDKKWQEEEKK